MCCCIVPPLPLFHLPFPLSPSLPYLSLASPSLPLATLSPASFPCLSPCPSLAFFSSLSFASPSLLTLLKLPLSPSPSFSLFSPSLSLGSLLPRPISLLPLSLASPSLPNAAFSLASFSCLSSCPSLAFFSCLSPLSPSLAFASLSFSHLSHSCLPCRFLLPLSLAALSLASLLCLTLVFPLSVIPFSLSLAPPSCLSLSPLPLSPLPLSVASPLPLPCLSITCFFTPCLSLFLASFSLAALFLASIALSLPIVPVTPAVTLRRETCRRQSHDFTSWEDAAFARLTISTDSLDAEDRAEVMLWNMVQHTELQAVPQTTLASR